MALIPVTVVIFTWVGLSSFNPLYKSFWVPVKAGTFFYIMRLLP